MTRGGGGGGWWGVVILVIGNKRGMHACCIIVILPCLVPICLTSRLMLHCLTRHQLYDGFRAGRYLTSKPTPPCLTSRPSLRCLTSRPTLRCLTSRPRLRCFTSRPKLRCFTSRPRLRCFTSRPRLRCLKNRLTSRCLTNGLTLSRAKNSCMIMLWNFARFMQETCVKSCTCITPENDTNVTGYSCPCSVINNSAHLYNQLHK